LVTGLPGRGGQRRPHAGHGRPPAVRKLQAIDPDLPVLLITGHGDVAEAVEAMHDGAYDFVAKPLPIERLAPASGGPWRSAGWCSTTAGCAPPPTTPRRLAPARPDPGHGAAAGHDAQLADAEVDVLMEGETGVGKELVARPCTPGAAARASSSWRWTAPPCPSAMIESELFGHEPGAFQGAMRQRIGRLQHAHRGTLFLDELEALPLEAQGKFLRVLEEREVTPLGGNAGTASTCGWWRR
jgi:two-component system C4-dicarboxylate transport response regulator DctD